MGVLPEDVEDDGRAVDRGPPEQLLQVELLGRCEFVVEHHGVGVDGEAQLLQLLGLALPEVPGVIGRIASLYEPCDLVGAGGVDEQRQLVEARVDRLVVVAGQCDRDQHDLLPDRSVDEGAGERFVVRVVRFVHRSSVSIEATNVAGPVRIARDGSSSVSATVAVPPSMWTIDFRLDRRHEAPRPCGERRRARPGATCRGDPCTTFVNAHRHCIRLRAGFDDLEVDLRHLRAEIDEVDDGHLVDTDDRMRVPHRQVRDRTIGMAAE